MNWTYFRTWNFYQIVGAVDGQCQGRSGGESSPNSDGRTLLATLYIQKVNGCVQINVCVIPLKDC